MAAGGKVITEGVGGKWKLRIKVKTVQKRLEKASLGFYKSKKSRKGLLGKKMWAKGEGGGGG